MIKMIKMTTAIKAFIIIFAILLLIIIFGTIQEGRVRTDFCDNNPNATQISSSDYTTYEKFLMTGNKCMNITEKIDCNSFKSVWLSLGQQVFYFSE